MNYHIEGEITRVTLDCDKQAVSIRLQPMPDFILKEGEVEKVVLVGEGLEGVVPCAVKDEFERLDFKIPCASRFADFLLTCKMNRCRVRIEVVRVEDESNSNFDVAVNGTKLRILSLSVV